MGFQHDAGSSACQILFKVPDEQAGGAGSVDQYALELADTRRARLLAGGEGGAGGGGRNARRRLQAQSWSAYQKCGCELDGACLRCRILP